MSMKTNELQISKLDLFELTSKKICSILNVNSSLSLNLYLKRSSVFKLGKLKTKDKQRLNVKNFSFLFSNHRN